MKTPAFLISRLPLFILLAAYLVFSVVTFKDYGITWDEYDVYRRGEALFNYNLGLDVPHNIDLVNSKNSSDFHLGNTIYNHSYPAFTYGIASIFNANTYETYHLLNMLFAVLIFIFSYEVLLKFYKNKYYAILGPIMLILTPRFFGDIPANPKDMPFAVVFFIGIALIYLLENTKHRFLKAITLGFVFATAFNFRILGITLYILYFLDLAYQIFKNRRQIPLKAQLLDNSRHLFLLLSTSLITVFLTWPYIASKPIFGLLDIVKSSSSFPWNGRVLFAEEVIRATQLSTSYIPQLFILTIPLLLLFLLVISFYTLRKIYKTRIIILLMSAIAFNMIAYILITPVVYDGIRHYLFLLPLISLICTFSLIELIRISKNLKFTYKIILFVPLILGALNILVNTAQLYPYHYIYFNELIGGVNGAYKKYETDYWGMSFKEATQWLIENEIKPDQNYKIRTCANPFQSSYYFASNMTWVKDIEDADYYICYTRYGDHLKVDQSKLIHSIDRAGIPLNLIYKLK